MNIKADIRRVSLASAIANGMAADELDQFRQNFDTTALAYEIRASGQRLGKVGKDACLTAYIEMFKEEFPHLVHQTAA